MLKSRRNGRILWLAYAAFAITVLVAGLFYAGERGQASALDALAEDAGSDAALKQALLLTAVGGHVRGMGLPTPPAHQLMVSQRVPASNKLGGGPPAAPKLAR